MSFVVFVSKRYLNPRQSLNFTSFVTSIAIFSIAISVTALVVVVAVMTGFESDLKSRIMKFEPHLMITERGGSALSGYSNIIHKMGVIAGITETSTFITTQAIVSTKKAALGTVIKGVQHYENIVSSGTMNLSQMPEQNLENTPPPIILKTDFMKALALTIGDIVYVTAPQGTITPLGYIPCVKKFQVTAFTDFDSVNGAYISINEAQKLLKLQDSVTGIEIKIGNMASTNKIAKIISSKIGNSLSLKSWEDMNVNLFSAMKLEKIVMLVILSLIVIIATFSITSSVAMFVFDKKKDIAILKVAGASNKDISKIFVIKGMAIGTIGTLLGTFTGIIISLIINACPVIKLPIETYCVTTLPVDLKTIDIALIAISALAMSFIATIYPVKRTFYTNLIQAIDHG